MAKVSEANPPGRHPGQGLLQVGKAGDELKLFLCLGLRKEATLSKARYYWKQILVADLLLTVLESLNPRKTHGVCREEEAAHGSVVNPAEWATPLFCCCGCPRLRPTHFD